MPLSSSSNPQKRDKELNASATYYKAGWRWSRQASTPPLSPHYEQQCDRLLGTFENNLLQLEDSTCIVGGETSPSRFRTTAAAYGTRIAPHTVDSKVLMPFMPFSLRSTLAHEALRDHLAIGPQASRQQHLTKSSRKVSTNSSPRLPTTVTSMPIHATLIDTTQDAAFPSTSHIDTVTVPSASLKSKRAESADSATLLSSAPLTFLSTLIPPPRLQDVGKLVVVLDLDETLVYSRDITIYKRPGVVQLLRTLKGKCEVIVWTAGTREYALDVIRIIDPACAVQHCIYRHPIWWTGDVGCVKDLRLLGRPMDRVLLVDNTPSVFRANPRNSLLVEDFIVPHPRAYNAQEKTLSVLADIFGRVFRHITSPCVADVLASKRISRQVIQLEQGGRVELNILTSA
ncbi:NLI interacting factor-like phosphatase, putative [Leishmania guyanensis]